MILRPNPEMCTEGVQTGWYKCPVSNSTASVLNTVLANLLQTDIGGEAQAQLSWFRALGFLNPSSWPEASPLEGVSGHTSAYPEPISTLGLAKATGPEREAGTAGVCPACFKWRYNRETEMRKTTSCNKEMAMHCLSTPKHRQKPSLILSAVITQKHAQKSEPLCQSRLHDCLARSLRTHVSLWSRPLGPPWCPDRNRQLGSCPAQASAAGCGRQLPQAAPSGHEHRWF